MADIVKKITKPNTDILELISNFSIEELEQVINYSADKYYNTSKSVITDEIYDILIDFLKLKSPKSQVLKNIGAKVKTKNKVKLDYWLGSMDKIKPPSNKLEIWSKKYSPPYNLSDKLDGVSALLTYTHDGSVNMYTRGTATEGTNITSLIKYLNLPSFDTIKSFCTKNKIKGDKNLIAFRGELIIKDSVFSKKWSKTLKNARNSVAGLVNSKTINPEFAKDTELVFYEIIEPSYPIVKQLEIITQIGFQTVHNKTINKNLTYEYLSDYLRERRNKSTYLIDGIIISSCENYERNSDGNPEYAFAFKDVLEDQIARTTVESIEWNISKDGLIKPTLILKPVSIGGVEIKRVTGNNAKYIFDNILGSGAEIEIIRSGDVIPKIQKIIKPAKSGKPDSPNGKWHWNQTNVDIILDNISTSQNVLVKNIYYFFSSLDTKGLGEKNVEKIVNSGLDSIQKILAADKTSFLTVDGFKEKSADNLVKSIKKAMSNVPLAKFMSASNKLGPGLGEERMKQVLSMYPNIITDYKKWSKSEFVKNIKEINGWEEKTASLLVSNFDDFMDFYNSVKKYINIISINIKTTGKFSQKTFVLTGFRDKDLQDKIEEQGGKIGSTISKSTDYLIVKDQTILDDPTDKVNKAISLDIKILTKDKIIKMLR